MILEKPCFRFGIWAVVLILYFVIYMAASIEALYNNKLSELTPAPEYNTIDEISDNLLFFAQISDIHIDQNDSGPEELFDEFLEQMKSHVSPALIVITGDLCDSKDGHYRHQVEAQWEIYKKVIYKHGLYDPEYIIDTIGNHDSWGVNSTIHPNFFFCKYSVSSQRADVCADYNAICNLGEEVVHREEDEVLTTVFSRKIAPINGKAINFVASSTDRYPTVGETYNLTGYIGQDRLDRMRSLISSEDMNILLIHSPLFIDYTDKDPLRIGAVRKELKSMGIDIALSGHLHENIDLPNKANLTDLAIRHFKDGGIYRLFAINPVSNLISYSTTKVNRYPLPIIISPQDVVQTGRLATNDVVVAVLFPPGVSEERAYECAKVSATANREEFILSPKGGTAKYITSMKDNTGRPITISKEELPIMIYQAEVELPEKGVLNAHVEWHCDAPANVEMYEDVAASVPFSFEDPMSVNEFMKQVSLKANTTSVSIIDKMDLSVVFFIVMPEVMFQLFFIVIQYVFVLGWPLAIFIKEIVKSKTRKELIVKHVPTLAAKLISLLQFWVQQSNADWKYNSVGAFLSVSSTMKLGSTNSANNPPTGASVNKEYYDTGFQFLCQFCYILWFLFDLFEYNLDYVLNRAVKGDVLVDADVEANGEHNKDTVSSVTKKDVTLHYVYISLYFIFFVITMAIIIMYFGEFFLLSPSLLVMYLYTLGMVVYGIVRGCVRK